MRTSTHLIGLVLTLVVVLGASASAQARTFNVVSCSANVPDPGPWAPDSTPWSRASAWCGRTEGMFIWGDIANGPRLPYGSITRWKLTVPGALRIRQLSANVRVVQGAGWFAGIVSNAEGAWLYGGPPCSYTCGHANWAPITLNTDSREISLQMNCADPAGCTTEVSSGIRDITATLEDPVAPQVAITGGTLTSGNWLAGDANVTFRVADADSGVQRTEILLDGRRTVGHDYECPGQRFLPVCPASLDDSAVIPTRQFVGDGPRVVTVRATDYSGNTTDRSFSVPLDNTAPIAPLALVSDGGEWSATNHFALRWNNPPQGSGAPVAAARWRLCRAGSNDSATCQSGRRYAAALSALDELQLPGPGLWQLELALVDAAGNSDLTNASKLTLGFDDTPPEVAIQPTNPEDPTRLQVNASDTLAPIARGEVELRRNGSSVWRPMPTQVTATGLEAIIDDELLDAGNYELRARAFNAAGLERSSELWTSGQKAVLTLPLRVATRARLGAARKSGGAKARTVLVRRPVLAYGRRVRLTGQLIAPGGNPLVDVPVQVSSRIEGPNTVWRPVAELRTDRSGHFRYVVARGPSRQIRFRYPGTPTIRSLTRVVSVRVRAATDIGVSRHRVVNGDAVRFRGRIRGGHLPARKRVELQFYARGKWRTFASTRANRRGRWGYTYRFDGTRGTVRWRFRALITPENGYPYTTGRSRAVTVTVRGLS